MKRSIAYTALFLAAVAVMSCDARAARRARVTTDTSADSVPHMIVLQLSNLPAQGDVERVTIRSIGPFPTRQAAERWFRSLPFGCDCGPFKEYGRVQWHVTPVESPEVVWPRRGGAK